MVDLELEQFVVFGIDHGRGNLLGIQPSMQVPDYLRGETFYDKLGGYLAEARRKGWINERTIAVFPEYIGTWLVIAGEGKGVYGVETLNAAMQHLVLAHPAAFARQFLFAKEKGRTEASLFRMKAGSMARLYSDVFSRLAQEYAVTLVAGSILLPEPQVVGSQVVPGAGSCPLQNVSAVFRPDGSLHPALSRKCFPTLDEHSFVSPGEAVDLPVFETPAWRLGVLVCADAWFPQAHARMKELGVDLLAVPSYINHAGAWDSPWGGYSGWPEAADVDRSDIKHLTEGQAWRKYTLPGRLASSGAAVGINVFMQAKLWDLGSDGFSIMAKGSETAEATTRRGALLNLWL